MKTMVNLVWFKNADISNGHVVIEDSETMSVDDVVINTINSDLLMIGAPELESFSTGDVSTYTALFPKVIMPCRKNAELLQNYEKLLQGYNEVKPKDVTPTLMKIIGVVEHILMKCKQGYIFGIERSK